MMGSQKIYRTNLGAGYYLDISFTFSGGNIHGKQQKITAVVTGPNNYKDIFTLTNSFTEEAYDAAVRHMASRGINHLSEVGEAGRDRWEFEEQNAKDKIKAGSSFVGITEEAFNNHFKIDVTKEPQRPKKPAPFVPTKSGIFDLKADSALEQEKRTHKSPHDALPIDRHPQHKVGSDVSVDYQALQARIKEADSIWEKNRQAEKEAEYIAYNNFVKRHHKELAKLSPWVEEYGSRKIRAKMQGLVVAEKVQDKNFYTLKTATKEVPLLGITKQVQHALGIRYDLVQSQWNPYGYKKKNGKAITDNRAAMEKGSRIHAYVDKGIKNGTWKVNPYDSNFIELINAKFPKKEGVRATLARSNQYAADVMNTLEELSKAQEVLNYLRTHYPETAGWKIKTEYTVSDYREYASSIDILAVNDRLKEAVIIDLKTGMTKTPYVSAQTSVYASFLRQNDTRYGGYNVKTGVLDFSNPVGGVSFSTLKQLSDKDVDKILYTKKDSTVGFIRQLWQKKGRTIHEGFNISKMQVAPFAPETLENVFNKRAIGADNFFSHGDIVSFDLETVPLSNGRMAIRSASLLNLYQRRNEDGIVTFHYKDKNALWEKAFLSSEKFNSTSILSADQMNALEMNRLSDAAVRAFEKAHAGMEGHHKKGIAKVMTSADILDIMNRMKGKTVIGHNILNFDFSVMLYTGMSLANAEGGAAAEDNFIVAFNDAFNKMNIIDTLELAKALQKGYEQVLPAITNEALLRTFSPATYEKLKHMLHQSSTDVLVTAKNLEVLMNGMTATERDILFNIIKGTKNKYIIQSGDARWMKKSEQKEGVGFNLNITNPLFIGKPSIISETQHWTVRAKNKARTELEKQAQLQERTEIGNLLNKYGVYFRREGDLLIFESAYQDEKRLNQIYKLADGAFSRIARVTKDKFGRLTAYLQGHDSIILLNIGDGFMAPGNSSFTISSLNTFLDEALANNEDKTFISDKFKAIKEVANVLSSIMEKHARSSNSFELLNTMLGKLNTDQAQWLYLHTDRLKSLYTINGVVDKDLQKVLQTGLELKLGTTPEQIVKLILNSQNSKIFGKALGVTTPAFMAKIKRMSPLRRGEVKSRIPTIKSWFDYYNSKDETSGLFGEAIQGTDFIEKLTYGRSDIPKAFRAKYEELSKSGAFDSLASGIAEEQIPLDTGTQIQQTLDKYREAMLMDNPEAYSMYKQGYVYTPGTKTSSDDFLNYYRNVLQPKKESEALAVFKEAWEKSKYQNHVAKLARLTDYTAQQNSDAQLAAWSKETAARKFNTERFIDQNIMFPWDKEQLRSTTNAAKVSNEQYIESLKGVQTETIKLNRILGATVGTLKNIPFYDPDQLFSASYHQIGNVHKSLTGVIPGFLNTSITKLFTGGVQDYELKWQKLKYGIRSAMPAFSLIGGTLGAVAGAPFGASLQMGAMGASALTGLGAWASQIVGNRYERAINETGLFFSSHFNKMGALLTPAIAALNLFTKALKIATVPLLAGIGAGIYKYKRALANMGNLDTPLSELTSVNYGSGYAETMRFDYALGMRRGTTNSIIENIEFAKQGLITLGRYDKSKLTSAAMLGILGEAYLNPGDGGGNYANLIAKLSAKMNAPGANKGRMMYLLNEWNPDVVKQVQAKAENDWFFSTSSKGKWYRDRTITPNDLSREDRAEMRAIHGITSALAESTQNATMKLAASFFRWRGFDIAKGFTNTINTAADAMAGGDPIKALDILKNGIVSFLKGIGETWEEVRQGLGIRSFKDYIVDTFKEIGAEVGLVLLKIPKWIIENSDKLIGVIEPVFKFIYKKFKDLFDFVGQIALDVDWANFGKPGFLQVRVGPKRDDKHAYSPDAPISEPFVSAFMHTANPENADKIKRLANYINFGDVNADSSSVNIVDDKKRKERIGKIYWALSALKVNTYSALEEKLTKLNPDYKGNYTDTEWGMLNYLRDVILQLKSSRDSDILDVALSTVSPFFNEGKEKAQEVVNKAEETLHIILETKDQNGNTQKRELTKQGNQSGEVTIGETATLAWFMGNQ